MGANGIYRVPLLPRTATVVRHCQNVRAETFQRRPPGKCLLPVPKYSAMGVRLGGVTQLYNVRGALACRVTQRAFTSRVALSRNISVRDISGVLKRDRVGAARICTRASPRHIFLSVRGVLPRLTRCRLAGWGHEAVGDAFTVLFCVSEDGAGRSKLYMVHYHVAYGKASSSFSARLRASPSR